MSYEEFAPQRELALKMPPLKHPQKVAELLVGAVDLHCHSGPAAMPRTLDHHDAMLDVADAKFKALVYKDHFYPGMAHALILEKLFPDTGVHLFSGLALNNASGGINAHAVDHTAKLGGKIVWMPTLAAANHHAQQASGQAKTFPKTNKKMLDPVLLTVLDANGRLIDEAKKVLDVVAETNIILASGHLAVPELVALFEEGRQRGVKKMMINHPTYIVGCSDEDIRSFVALGVSMEHSICMFVEGRSKKYTPEQLVHLIDIAGIDHTILGSDLGLVNGPRPVDGFRAVVDMLIDLEYSEADIRKMISSNAARLLDLQ